MCALGLTFLVVLTLGLKQKLALHKTRRTLMRSRSAAMFVDNKLDFMSASTTRDPVHTSRHFPTKISVNAVTIRSNSDSHDRGPTTPHAPKPVNECENFLDEVFGGPASGALPSSANQLLSEPLILI